MQGESDFIEVHTLDSEGSIPTCGLQIKKDK